MKSKDKVSVYQEMFSRGCILTSELASQLEDRQFHFQVEENPSRKIQDITYFGLIAAVIVRQEGKQPEFKKLFDRSYKLVGRSLNEVREQAYTELADVMCATFLLTGYRTPVEDLQAVSNPHSFSLDEKLLDLSGQIT